MSCKANWPWAIPNVTILSLGTCLPDAGDFVPVFVTGARNMAKASWSTSWLSFSPDLVKASSNCLSSGGITRSRRFIAVAEFSIAR